MGLLQITPLILTFNERENIVRTLEGLSWAQSILIVDSGSTDETCEAASKNPRVHIVQRPFTSFADQCNFGLTQISTPWVLSMDADYVLSQELIEEIGRLQPAEDIEGYRVGFRYCVNGRPLRSSLYPPRVVLYRKDRARYENDGHGHRVCLSGKIEELTGVIFHDDRKPIARWFTEQRKYSHREAEKLLRTPIERLNFPDRVRRKIVFAPGLVFLYTLFWQRLILDGRSGWLYVFQRTFSELLLSMRLIQQKIKGERGSSIPETTHVR